MDNHMMEETIIWTFEEKKVLPLPSQYVDTYYVLNLKCRRIKRSDLFTCLNKYLFSIGYPNWLSWSYFCFLGKNVFTIFSKNC